MRRGELRAYTQPSTPDTRRTVVVLSSANVNDSERPWLLGVELRHCDPGDLLAVPVGDGRFAYAGELRRLYRAWLGVRVGRLDTTTVARLDNALRAALDL